MINRILALFDYKLEKCSHSQSDDVATMSKDGGDENIGVLRLKYEFMVKCMERERERMKSIEAKAAMFVGSTSIMGALLVGCGNIMMSEENGIKLIVLLFLLLLVFLLACTIMFSIKTLKKRLFYMLEPNDIVEIKTEEEYYKKLIKDIEKVIKHNQSVTNLKVDSMQKAQNYFNYFWIATVLYIILFVIIEMLSLIHIVDICDYIHSIPILLVVCFAAVMGYLVNGELVAITKE